LLLGLLNSMDDTCAMTAQACVRVSGGESAAADQMGLTIRRRMVIHSFSPASPTSGIAGVLLPDAHLVLKPHLY
jgi:hypothetical protein